MTLRQYRERIDFGVWPRNVVRVRYRGVYLRAFVNENCWRRLRDDGYIDTRVVRYGLTAKQAYALAWETCLVVHGKGRRLS